jgi:hypothetical protein
MRIEVFEDGRDCGQPSRMVNQDAAVMWTEAKFIIVVKWPMQTDLDVMTFNTKEAAARFFEGNIRPTTARVLYKSWGSGGENGD